MTNRNVKIILIGVFLFIFQIIKCQTSVISNTRKKYNAKQPVIRLENDCAGM